MTELRERQFTISGLRCVSCAKGVESELKRGGATDAEVHYPSGRSRVAVSSDTSDANLEGRIKKLGYGVTFHGDGESTAHGSEVGDAHGEAERLLIQRAKIAAALTAPLFFSMFFPIPFVSALLHQPVVQLVVTAPVYLIGLLSFGPSALGAIRTRTPNMDLLILIGASAAFIYSLIGTIGGFGHDYLFYETAASIITIVLFGNILEHRATSKAQNAVAELYKIRPTKVRRLIRDVGAMGDTVAREEIRLEEVSLDAIERDDRLSVGVGDVLSVDGIIEWGEGSLDESLVTGESVPVSRAVGDSVIAGSTVVQGAFTVRVTERGEGTTLALIGTLIERAQSIKPELHKLADRVSVYFTPIILAASLLTLVASYVVADLSLGNSLMRAIAVLVIACPCAIGLATPAAVMVSVSMAARRGVLVRAGRAFEDLDKATVFLFDKTGTLTTGEFTVKRVALGEVAHQDEGSPGDEDTLRAVVKGLEEHSTHPIAVSLVKAFRTVPSHQFSSVSEMRGEGIEGVDSRGDVYRVRRHVGVAEGEASGGVLIEVVKNGERWGVIELDDSIRPDVEGVLATLRSEGKRIVMLSGDRPDRCRRVAENLGIKEYHGGVTPEGKLAMVEEFSRKATVVMVGDGINDAASLRAASVGISFGGASSVALQAADIVLLSGSFRGLSYARVIARQTVGTMKQNLFWAFAYNIVAVPVAALGYLSPTLGALTMGVSDLIIIGNSLRLRMMFPVR